MTLVEHLEELRRRLFIALGAIAIGSIVGWFLYDAVVRLLLHPYCDYWRTVPPQVRPTKECTLFFMGAVDPVLLKLKVVVFLGLFLALPVVLFQIWGFIVPGLTTATTSIGTLTARWCGTATTSCSGSPARSSFRSSRATGSCPS